MIKKLRLELKPEIAFAEEARKKEIGKRLGLKSNDSWTEKILKRSIDARRKPVKVVLDVEAYVDESPVVDKSGFFQPKSVHNGQPVVIVGCGPAGLFSALRLIELGFKPIVIERGKDVQSRRRDLARINKEHIVNPNSNYCFGEGGAGTYSDGKLYTRSKKRGSVERVLKMLYQHGSPEDILIDAHPHIGTNKLPKVVEALRESILECGGEILFDALVTNFLLDSKGMNGVEVNGSQRIKASNVVLATGHSARDIYTLCHQNGIKIDPKPFALGVRVEHPQQLIDSTQYHCDNRGEFLPAASYALVHQTFVNDIQRGVFSFCMCPGGFIVPAATGPEEVVVNGMSPSKRNSYYANSGIVVAVELDDMKKYAKNGPFMGVEFQREIERSAYEAGGKTQSAPAQRMVDFVEGKTSEDLNSCSYIPGLTSTDLSTVLPENMVQRLREAFQAFGKKMKGYYTNEANVVGVESRSSAPVRIPRDKDTLEHVEVSGLFPCGEGAGYAGGIVSAAIDGMKCADAIAIKMGISPSS